MPGGEEEMTRSSMARNEETEGARIVSGASAPKCDFCRSRKVLVQFGRGWRKVVRCEVCLRDPFGKRKLKDRGRGEGS